MTFSLKAGVETSSHTGTVGLLLGIAAATVAVRLPGTLSRINVSAAIAIVGVLTVLYLDRHRLYLMRLTRLDLALVVFVTIRCFTDLVDSASLDIVLPVAALGDWGIILFAYFALRVTVDSLPDLITFLKYFIAPSYVVAAIAMLQIAGVGIVHEFITTFTRSPGLQNRLSLGWTEIRATSTIGHWTALGGYLVVMIAACCALIAYFAKSEGQTKWRYVVGLSILVGGLFSTATFAPIIVGGAVALVTMLIYFRRVDLVILGAIPLLAFLYTLLPLLLGRLDKQTYANAGYTSPYPWLPESVGYRVNIWVNESIPGGMRRPLFGWGSSVYDRLLESTAPPELRWISPESEWIRSFVTGGWLVLIAEVVLLLVLVITVWRICKRRDFAWLKPVLWAIVGLLIISTVHSHFTNRGVPLAVWPIVGAIVAASATQRITGDQPTSLVSSSRVRLAGPESRRIISRR